MKTSAQQVVPGERSARGFKLRMAIDIITDILEIIIALTKTDSLFIGPSLPYLRKLVNRLTQADYQRLIRCFQSVFRVAIIAIQPIMT